MLMEKKIVYIYKCSKCGYIMHSPSDFGDKECPACIEDADHYKKDCMDMLDCGD
jgi:rubrerythrin